MASVIRRTYTKIVAGKKVTRKYKHWTIQYRDAAGKIKRVKGYTDRGATKQLAAKLEASAAHGEQNMVDPFRVSRRSPLIDKNGEKETGHIPDYIAHLEASGRDDKYVYNQRNRLTRLAQECKWACLDDIEPNSFMRWRDKERKDEGTRHGRMSKGAAATTLNQYLSTARAFTNWCATVNRIYGVPLAGGKKMSTLLSGVEEVDGDTVRKQRAFTDAQWLKMLEVAPDRELVYRFGVATGLRRKELEDLVWGDVRLNAIKPYIQLRAWATKARRGDRIDLTQTLADAIRAIKPDGIGDRARVFAQVPGIDQWKRDLTAAGIDYKDEMGRQLDFHGGCRKTLTTRMHAAGVPQREAMRRLRVTDPKLLNETYADDEQLSAGSVPLPEVTGVAGTKKSVSSAG